MTYFVYPTGAPSHKVVLEARSTGTIPSGLSIQWRRDGSALKLGNTSSAADLSVNTVNIPLAPWSAQATKAVGAYVTPSNRLLFQCTTAGMTGNAEPTWPTTAGLTVSDGSATWTCVDAMFTAADAGCVIDFVINGTDTSTPVVLSNNLPTLGSAGPAVDGFSTTNPQPTFSWVYADADWDPQFYYRVMVGTAPLLGDLYDSGKTFSAVGEDDGCPDLGFGVSYHWTIIATDGQKTNPTDPDLSTTPRQEVMAQGLATTDMPPQASNIKLDGIEPSNPVPRQSFDWQPTITWDYDDPDGHPQAGFDITVTDPDGQVIWQTPMMASADQIALYDFDGGATRPLPSHVALTFTIRAYNAWGYAGPAASAVFVISTPPVIDKASVDNKQNPLNLNPKPPPEGDDGRPTFTWDCQDYDEAGVLSKAILGYEIRIADNDGNLGTNSFVGNVWMPGVVMSPPVGETLFLTRYNPNACYYGALKPSVTYFFQVKVFDAYDQSAWYTGFFRLNNPPWLTDVAISPLSPYHNQDLTATYVFHDDPGDVESEALTEIKWYRQSIVDSDFSEVASVRNKKVVPASILRPQDQWFYTVRPSDGTDYGELYSSIPPGGRAVMVRNRAPMVSNLAILPGRPRTNDNLNAVYLTSDDDGDPVSVAIRWFRNGAHQADLDNATVVPASYTEVDDQWYFVATPNDSYVDGTPAQSPTVTVLNSPPRVTSMVVDSMILPRRLTDANPKIAWSYLDADGHPQEAYQFILGTKPAKTKLPNGLIPASQAQVDLAQGIMSTASSGGTLTGGDELYDSGIVQSAVGYFQYATPDYVPDVVLGPMDASAYAGYTLETDAKTFALQQGQASGNVGFSFSGTAGLYEVELTYVLDPKRKSRFKTSVDGAAVDEFVTETGIGSKARVSKFVQVSPSSSILISGYAADSGALAKFTQVRLIPVTQFSVRAGDFPTLSGYLSDDNGVIRLQGQAGMATLPFPYPSGTYDVELTYITEMAGSPTVAVLVGTSTIMSFSYEVGAATRTRTATGVTIAAGAVLTIKGTRAGGAAARVESVTFTPTQGLRVGASLSDGYTYYGSVKVYDGRDWSDWYSTRFTMDGSAWVSGVSNDTGWTIEARIQLRKTS